MNRLMIALSVLLIAACSSGQPVGTSHDKLKIVCLEGVEYYLFREASGYGGFGYMSVKFNRDSTVSTC